MQVQTPPIYSRLNDTYRPMPSQDEIQKKSKRLKIIKYTGIGIGSAGLIVTLVFIVIYARSYAAALASKATSVAAMRATTFKKKNRAAKLKQQQAMEQEEEYTEDQEQYDQDNQQYEQGNQQYIPQFLPMGDDGGMSEL